MRILLVKTSSMGDVIHNLPVMSDMRRNIPGAAIDWVVEEDFAAIPALHPGVRRVIPVAIRRWRKSWLSAQTLSEVKKFGTELRRDAYDAVLDTQGLTKSAVIARLARGKRLGYLKTSAREPLAALLYDQGFDVPKGQHAVERNRQLAGQALGYPIDAELNYGITAPGLPNDGTLARPYGVLLHVTSRASKLWPEPNWVQVGAYLASLGIGCVLPWGTARERERSEALAGKIPGAVVPPSLALEQAAALLGGAQLVIGVDTGLAHLAAALGRPVAGVYCATEPGLTGIYGPGSVNLGAAGRPPEALEVIAAVERLLA
jgi:heptosyltransferase I